MYGYVRKIFSIGISIAFLILFFYIADFQWEDVWHKILDGAWKSLLGVTTFTIIIYLLSAVKWSIIIVDLNPDIGFVSVRSLFGYLSLSNFFGLFIPQLADVVIRSAALKKVNNISMYFGVYTVLIDRITNFFAAMIYAPSGILFTKSVSKDVAVVIACAAIILLLVCFLVFNRWIFKWFGKSYAFVLSWIYRLPVMKKRLDQPIPGMDFMLTSRAGLQCISLSLAHNIMIFARLYFIVWSMDLQIDFFYLFWCCSMMFIFSLVLIVPGQFGVGEMGWYALLRLSGVPDTDIIIFLSGSFIFSSLAMILIGLPTWLNSELFDGSAKPRVPMM